MAAALALATACRTVAPAQAQVPLFLDTCVAEAGDLDRLPLAFAHAGLTEVDRTAGPPGPAIATPSPDRRLWSAPGRSGTGERFAGYSPAGATSLAVCWVVSRPGMSAADMLVELKRRVPPRQGTTRRGTAAFYGGSETWAAEVRGIEVILGVDWPIRQAPEQGAGLVYLARPRHQGGGTRSTMTTMTERPLSPAHLIEAVVLNRRSGPDPGRTMVGRARRHPCAGQHHAGFLGREPRRRCRATSWTGRHGG